MDASNFCACLARSWFVAAMQAGAKPVVLKRWCCGAADLLRNHDSQHVPTVLTVAVHERRRDILQTPVVKMIFEHKWEVCMHVCVCDRSNHM